MLQREVRPHGTGVQLNSPATRRGGGPPSRRLPDPIPPIPMVGRPESQNPYPLSPPIPMCSLSKVGFGGSGPFLLAMQYKTKTMLKNVYTKYIDFPMLNYPFTANV